MIPRRLRPSAMRGLALALTLAGLGGLAWLGEQTEARLYLGSSTTATLGEPSRELASQLAGPVAVTVALPPGHALRRHARRLVRAYSQYHKPFELTFVDPEAQRQRARKLGLVRTGQTLVEYSGRAETLDSPTEARLSRALERLLRDGEPFVAFLTSNGTRDLAGQGNYGLGALGKALERKGYRLQPLELAAIGAVPANARIVVIAAPAESLGIREQAALRQYLRQGGAVLWLGEPDGPDPDPILPVRISDEAVTDTDADSRLGVDDERFLVLEPPFDHPAARGVEHPVVLFGAGTVASQSSNGWRRQTLLARPQRTQGPDRAALAVSLNHAEWGSRAVVTGDVDAWSNTYLGNGDNLRLAVQTVDWLADAERFIGTYVEAAPDQRLTIDRRRGIPVALALLGGIPALLVLTAVWRWRCLRRG